MCTGSQGPIDTRWWAVTSVSMRCRPPFSGSSFLTFCLGSKGVEPMRTAISVSSPTPASNIRSGCRRRLTAVATPSISTSSEHPDGTSCVAYLGGPRDRSGGLLSAAAAPPALFRRGSDTARGTFRSPSRRAVRCWRCRFFPELDRERARERGRAAAIEEFYAN